LRNRYGLSVLAIGKGEKFEINPSPQSILNKDSVMVVIGSNKDIDRLPI